MKNYDNFDKTSLEKEKKRLNLYLNLLILAFFCKVLLIYFIESQYGTEVAVIAIVLILFILYKLFEAIDVRKKAIEKQLRAAGK